MNQYFFGDYMVGSVPVPEATPTPEPSVEEVAEKDLENTEDGKQTDISESADKEIQESGEKTEASGEILQLRKEKIILRPVRINRTFPMSGQEPDFR